MSERRSAPSVSASVCAPGATGSRKRTLSLAGSGSAEASGRRRSRPSPRRPSTGAASSLPRTAIGIIGHGGAQRGAERLEAVKRPQPVARAQHLRRTGLREREHELALVEEQAMEIGRMGVDAARLDEQHVEPGDAPEPPIGGEVDRSRTRSALADRLGDHRRIGGQRPGVVGDQQRGPVDRNARDPLDLDPEPVVVEEVVDDAVQRPLDELRAAPVADVALGLEPGQMRAQPSRRALPAAGQGDRGRLAFASVLAGGTHRVRLLQGGWQGVDGPVRAGTAGGCGSRAG